MHQSHQQQQQQTQPHQSHHNTPNAHNHQQHHPHHQGPLNQQQQHHPQMHHPQSHQQGPPPPQSQQMHQHQQHIAHHHNHHPHHHNLHHAHHHHQSNQPQQQHTISQQPPGPPLNQQHISLTISGSLHSPISAPAPHLIPHTHQQQQQPHIPQPHVTHLPHSGQPHPQPSQAAQHQHVPHAPQQSQPSAALHHTTGTVHQRQQHQPHAHHHPVQQPQAVPPAHNAMQHPMMINQGHYNPNMVFPHPGPHPYPNGPMAPTYNTSTPSHRPDTVNNLNPQSTSVNPNSIPPLSQMNPSVISSVATGTSNVHHQTNTGPLMDPSLQSRLQLGPRPQFIMQPGFNSYNMMPMNPYSHMTPQYHNIQPSPTMMQPRIPSDISGVRHQFEHQNHANIANKVPLSQAQMMGIKHPAPYPNITGLNPAQPMITPILRKREKKPALIKDPNTGQQLKFDDQKSQEPASSKQESAATAESTTSNSSEPGPCTAQAETVVTTTQTTTTDDAPVKSKDQSESLEVDMSNLKIHTDTNNATNNIAIEQNQTPDATDAFITTQEITKEVIESTDGLKSTDSELAQGDTPIAASTIIENTSQTTPESVSDTKTNSVVSPDQVDTLKAEPSQQQKLVTDKSYDEPDRALPPKSAVVEVSTNTVIVEQSKEPEKIGADEAKDSPVTSEKVDSTCEHKPEKKPLNLPYQPGQYSPQNPSGKRKYTYEFLMAVMKMMKPELDAIDPPMGNPRHDFMAPSFIQTPNFANYRDLPASSRRSSQQANARPKRVIATTSLQPEIELKSSENAWKPELEQEKTKAVEGEMDTTRLLKVFRGHLNKLTPQKYDSIISKVADLDLDGPERLTSVIDLVFDKAVDEPGFCELYAMMCKVIASKHKEFFFHLVKKCQEEFETNDLYDGLNVDGRKDDIEKESDPMRKKLMSEELYEDMRLRRKKYLGTIKLIGEMYKFGLLIPKIIGLCMKQLIEGASNENLECLCSLLATVGAKMATEEDSVIKDSLNQTLKVLHEFAHSKKLEDHFVLESRIKFKILDTIDLSRKNWRPRMVENNPKKIEEIREEIKEDKLRQQQHNHSSQSRNMMKNDDRDRHRRLGNSFGKGQNKWT